MYVDSVCVWLVGLCGALLCVVCWCCLVLFGVDCGCLELFGVVHFCVVVCCVSALFTVVVWCFL